MRTRLLSECNSPCWLENLVLVGLRGTSVFSFTHFDLWRSTGTQPHAPAGDDTL